MLLSKILLPVLAAVGVSATPVAAPAAAEPVTAVNTTEPRSISKRSFLDTCEGNGFGAAFQLINGINLNGKCLNNANQWTQTTINLDNCLTNNNGVLQWKRNGVFSFRCTQTRLRHHYLDDLHLYFWANCYNNNNVLTQSEIYLNTHIHNWDGSFACTPPN